MTKAVITALLKSKVHALASIDRDEYAAGHRLEDIIPTEILDMFREQYDPLLTNEEISLWYSEMLKGGPEHEQNP